MENNVSFPPPHIRLLGPQTVVLQADAITKLPQQFWGREGESEEDAFMGMIGVTGQDESDKSKG